MAWIESTVTITNDKGPQLICINPANVKYIKQRDDGRALVVFVAGQAHTLDDTYVEITGRLR